MKVGIDLRPLQNGHKYRGIGEVVKQVTQRILPKLADDGHQVIFYENDESDPKELLDLPGNLDFDVIKLGKMPENDKTATKGQKFARNWDALFGSPIENSGEVDVFLQYDYAAGVPKNTKTLLVKHDLIPYIFWDKYFESAWVPFKNKAARTTLRTLFANYRYKRVLKRSLRDAERIVTVSKSTKDDLERYFHVPAEKVEAVLLGVDMKPAKTTNDAQKPSRMPSKPYLIFIGAGDARRRVDDLVVAYNNLKADGHDIQLVLVGENFKKPTHIPNTIVRKEVLGSSYVDDIITMGYVDDQTKQKLLQGALAYVYPTKYEGFGIPILEAMLAECPIIVYKNSSTPEVGGKHAIYAKDWTEIVREVKNLINQPKKDRQEKLEAAKKHAQKFTWEKTADGIYEQLLLTKKG